MATDWHTQARSLALSSLGLCRAQGYKRFGINRSDGATTYREWAPAAQAAWLIGDFNDWQGTELQRDEFGVWSVTLSDNADGSAAIPHKSRVKVRLQRDDGGTIDLVPAWIRYAVMPEGQGATFDGVHWDPPARERHRWCEPNALTNFDTCVPRQWSTRHACGATTYPLCSRKVRA